MRIKQFIRHPRGGATRKERQRTIEDTKKQIRYLEAIGNPNNDLAYYKEFLKHQERFS